MTDRFSEGRDEVGNDERNRNPLQRADGRRRLDRATVEISGQRCVWDWSASYVFDSDLNSDCLGRSGIQAGSPRAPAHEIFRGELSDLRNVSTSRSSAPSTS